MILFDCKTGKRNSEAKRELGQPMIQTRGQACFTHENLAWDRHKARATLSPVVVADTRATSMSLQTQTQLVNMSFDYTVSSL